MSGRLLPLFLVPFFSVALAATADLPEGHDITWRLSGPGGGGWIESLAFDPRDTDVLYAGCDVGGFYFSADAGRTWEVRNEGLHDYFIESIAVSPADHNVILLGTESGIHRTANLGALWSSLQESSFPLIVGGKAAHY